MRCIRPRYTKAYDFTLTLMVLIFRWHFCISCGVYQRGTMDWSMWWHILFLISSKNVLSAAFIVNFSFIDFISSISNKPSFLCVALAFLFAIFIKCSVWVSVHVRLVRRHAYLLFPYDTCNLAQSGGQQQSSNEMINNKSMSLCLIMLPLWVRFAILLGPCCYLG